MNNIAQWNKVLEQESYGWVLDEDSERDRLLSALPIRMRNMMGEISYVYADGSMAPVLSEGRLLSISDITKFGKIRPGILGHVQDYLDQIRLISLYGLCSRR